MTTTAQSYAASHVADGKYSELKPQVSNGCRVPRSKIALLWRLFAKRLRRTPHRATQYMKYVGRTVLCLPKATPKAAPNATEGSWRLVLLVQMLGNTVAVWLLLQML